ncbi:MAG: hypothetical protein RUDDFDWM_001676 [Candidatus Fervidibacterota bacterium]
MTPRERVWRAIHHQYPDKVPKEAGFTPSAYERFKQETGCDDPAEYFGFETRSVDFKPLKPEDFPDFTPYLKRLPEGTIIANEYGVAHLPGRFYHFVKHVFPLSHAESVKDIERYPFPDVTLTYRHEHLEEEVERLHRLGYFVSGFAGHIFETAWQLIGMEKMFIDMLFNPALVEALLERLTLDACFRARRFAEAGVDMLRTGDDVGMQDRLMMNPELWRRFLKPCLKRVIDSAREVVPDIPVWYHSDGYIMPIIDDLIEVGVTVLNPVQPECMDVVEIKKRYGEKLAVWGTIGTQSVLPFGKPEDVKMEVKRMIEIFAPAIVIAPTHVIEPDVPWENIVALFEAVEEYGRFC